MNVMATQLCVILMLNVIIQLDLINVIVIQVMKEIIQQNVQVNLFLNELLNIFSISDVDECLQPNTCNQFGICNNTEGSFECMCIEGYTGDGLNCSCKIA